MVECVGVHPGVVRSGIWQGRLLVLVQECVPVVPVAQMIMDFAIPCWTWDLPVPSTRSAPYLDLRWVAEHRKYAALDIATLDASGSRLTTRDVGAQSPAWARWTTLRLGQRLWPGDTVSLCFTIPPDYEGRTYTMHAGVAGSVEGVEEEPSDHVVFVSYFQPATSIEHAGTMSAVRPHDLDDCGNVISTKMAFVERKMAQLSQITMTRDDTMVRMRVDIGDQVREFPLSVALRAECLSPIIRFYMYKRANPTGWTINAVPAPVPPAPPA
jgi:hypothetical protein